MERPISSIAFKGTISEAILEAKLQKKLFVVYLSGENAESVLLETSTWTESNVTEALSKYCILLHILEGSADAAHFSAIYPQKSVPCITVIGFNGVHLWQAEGFVSSEILASSLEKAWLGLHIQETTFTFLTAAIASKESLSSTSEVHNLDTSYEEGGSSTEASQSLNDRDLQSNGDRMVASPNTIEENINFKCLVENQESSLKPRSADKLDGCGEKQSMSSTERAKESLHPVTTDPDCPLVVSNTPSSLEGRSEPEASEGTSQVISATVNKLDGCGEKQSMSSTQRAKVSLSPVAADPDSPLAVSNIPPTVEGRSPAPEASEGTLQLIADKSKETAKDKMPHLWEDNKTTVLDTGTSISKSNDVYLNIRLPDGTSVQKKFSLATILSVVKDFVNEYQPSGISSYSLAIPYPRKVFNDEDLSKSLSDLGLFDRQGLIVVPHHQSTIEHKKSIEPSNGSTNEDSLNNGRYLGYVKKILSFMNPFSYLYGGVSSSSSSQESQGSQWQYDPNPAMHPYIPNPPNGNAPGNRTSNQNSRQPTTSRIGSNIHTLKHDEDDKFNDKNAFWNGNSTQYGGNNDGK